MTSKAVVIEHIRKLILSFIVLTFAEPLSGCNLQVDKVPEKFALKDSKQPQFSNEHIAVLRRDDTLTKTELIFSNDALQNISQQARQNAKKTGLWNSDNSKYAFCYSDQTSQCFVAVIENEKVQLIDVSDVITGNLGKLAIDMSQWDKVQTYPSKFKELSGDGFFINFVTEAWIDRQKFTAEENLFIKGNVPAYR